MRVDFLAEDVYSDVHTITVHDKDTGLPKHLVIRIALPTLGYYKTESDVATTELVRHLQTFRCQSFTPLVPPLRTIWDSSGYSWRKLKAKA